MSVWGTSGPRPHAEAFLGRRDHRISGPKGPHRHASPHNAPGFAWGRGHTLDQGKPPPRPATRPRHSTRSTPRRPTQTRPSPANPKEGRFRRKCVFGQGAACRSKGRYGNINPFIHSTTPVGLALGPDSPGADQLDPGTLGYSADGFPTRQNATHACILTRAHSTPGHPDASRHAQRSPTHPHARHRTQGPAPGTRADATASADGLSPAELSARNHLTSELLRTLSRMAASKPTSWLSPQLHILFHLAAPWGP